MNIQIEKFKSRFSVKCNYDDKVLELIQKIEKRFWDKSKLEWTLPIAAFENFSNEISKLSGYTIEIKENKPLALLSKNNGIYELKFVHFTDQYDNFRNIDYVEYDKENKKLLVPEKKFQEVLDFLKTKCIGYYISYKKSEIFNEQDNFKRKKLLKNATNNKIRQQSTISNESTTHGN